MFTTTSGQTGELNGVTIAADTTFTGQDGSTTLVERSITNEGTIALDSTGSNTPLLMLPNQTMPPSGSTVSLSNQNNNNIGVNVGSGNLINVDNTIARSWRGQSGSRRHIAALRRGDALSRRPSSVAF